MRRIRLVTVQGLSLYSASSGAHRNFSKQDYKKWLKEADSEALAHADSLSISEPEILNTCLSVKVDYGLVTFT